jgi:hypothetical protein
VFVRHIEGSKYALAASTTTTFRDPREEAEALDLRFDRREDAWQKIDGDRVAGPIVLAPKKR